MTSPYRPPSCDLPAKFYLPKLKPCPYCGASSEHYEPNAFVKCRNLACSALGPNEDKSGHKWNFIPRRSEVLELLRLVDEVLSCGESIVDTSNFPEDGFIAHDFIKLQAYADKLRKELGE